MGQYYLICNIDKKEYLYSHTFGDGLKLLEFGCSGMGMLTGLTILLADGNGRGGGDLHSDNPIIGSWAGDRIVIAGDYADEGKFVPEENKDENLYHYTNEHYTDISEKVLHALIDDEYIAEPLAESIGRYMWSKMSQDIQDRLSPYRKEPK